MRSGAQNQLLRSQPDYLHLERWKRLPEQELCIGIGKYR